MLDHAREAAELVRLRVVRDLDRERVLTLAPVQVCQILGEAASRVSEARRTQYPEVPWAKSRLCAIA